MRTTFDRLSNVSCPLIASTTYFGALAEHDGHAVAADEPAAFVGDRVRRLPRVEPLVDRRGEAFELLPQRLLGDEVAQAAGLQVLAGQLADLHEEPQVAALRRRPGAGALEDFDQAVDAAIGADRRHDQQDTRSGWRRPPRRPRRAPVPECGRHQHRLAALGDLPQQPGVLRLGRLARRPGRSAAG